MRIIGGKYKRRRFDVPKSFNARPTTDFAKENLFNVLQQYLDLEGLTALDLFSGTGSIALELLSRGCSRVVALEQRREHALFIRSVVRELGEERSLQVLQADVFRYLATATSARSTASSSPTRPTSSARSRRCPSSSTTRGCCVRGASSSSSTPRSMTSARCPTSVSAASMAR